MDDVEHGVVKRVAASVIPPALEARLDAELRVQRQAAAELALESEQLAAELAELQATREAEVAAESRGGPKAKENGSTRTRQGRQVS